jgi:steroid delta-isomerase-like uncharacterized protein
MSQADTEVAARPEAEAKPEVAARPEAEAKRLARRLYELVNAHDPAALDEVFAPDFRGHGLGEAGIEGLREEFGYFLAAFPDLRITVEDLVVEGDRVVARVTYWGTQQERFAGIPPYGRRMQVSGVDIHRVANGRIAETWSMFDMAAATQQLKRV